MPELNTPYETLEKKTIERLEFLSDRFRFRSHFSIPADLSNSIGQLTEDLRLVPVIGANGKFTNAFDKFEAEPCLSKADRQLIWSSLAIVRDAFLHSEKLTSKQSNDQGYQWNMNWKHTRAEIDQVLEACKLLQLDSQATRDALLASIFSDSVKNPKNFIVHNIHGAQAAAYVLSCLLDMSKEENLLTIERVSTAVKQHQIAPPEFMAKVVAIMLYQKMHLGHFNPDQSHEFSEDKTDLVIVRRLVRSIFDKIKDPLKTSNLTEDLTCINFTSAERQLLVNIGIEDWFVPHPHHRDSLIAHAVIAGDHSINYNHPEGFAKIALLRGPHTDVIFEDATIHESLQSAIQSFTDSFRIIRPEVQTLTVAGLRRSMNALARVNAVMNELFNGIVIGPSKGAIRLEGKLVRDAIDRAQSKNPLLFAIDQSAVPERIRIQIKASITTVIKILEDWSCEYGEIPFNQPALAEPGIISGFLPFWNAPLKYPQRDEYGDLKMDELTELERKQFAFATRIREIAVEFLRAEQLMFGASNL